MIGKGVFFLFSFPRHKHSHTAVMSKKLYQKIKKQNIEYRHVAEVGVYKPESASSVGFINEGVLCSLFEANPDIAKEITERFANRKNVRIYPYAICGFNGKVKLHKAGASSFLDSVAASPALLHDNYVKKEYNAVEVEARVFSAFDEGDIDVLYVDVEGGEWDVIKEMRSRPKVLCLEIKSRDYTNPHIGQLTNWLEKNSYEIWFSDDTDTIFVKKGIVRIGLLQKIARRIHSVRYFRGKLA